MTQEEINPRRRLLWPLILFAIPAFLWGRFVVSYVFDPFARDPRELVLFMFLTPLLVYTALSGWFLLSGQPVNGRWRALFVLLGLLAAIPSVRVAEILAQFTEARSMERLHDPVLRELRARQAKTARPPVEMEDILRRHPPDIPEQNWRLRSFTYYFDDRSWALQTPAVSGDRDDDATLTTTAEGRTIRHDSGDDGGGEASQTLLLAEIPFLAQARSCHCRRDPVGPGAGWLCTAPCGTWTPSTPNGPEPSPSTTPSPAPDASPSATPPARR